MKKMYDWTWQNKAEMYVRGRNGPILLFQAKVFKIEPKWQKLFYGQKWQIGTKLRTKDQNNIKIVEKASYPSFT